MAEIDLLNSQLYLFSAEEEQVDLSRITGALLVNIGTVSELQVKTARRAGIAANELHRPVVLDPVGVGASEFRHNTIQGRDFESSFRVLILNRIYLELLASWRPSVITGNAAEVAHIFGLVRHPIATIHTRIAY